MVTSLASLHDGVTPDDPIAWYHARHGAKPDYRSVLTEAAPSLADRRNLLSGYFAPNNANGERVPTRAHHAIAGLVADNYFRVIVTTNFDKLMETALSEAGVDPQVIFSAATAASARPLVHSPCTVIKVNGDYLSSDMKNTAEELASFDTEVTELLQQVFRDFGLIACGWSAEWDTALRQTITQTPNHNYSTYWMDRGSVTTEAENLIRQRQAIRVPISDADSAFEQLAGDIAALARLAGDKPLETAVAVERLKTHMSDSTKYIELHDLIVDETDRLITSVRELPVTGVDVRAIYPERVREYEEASAQLMSLLATGAYFSRNNEHDRLWSKSIDLLANREMPQSGSVPLLDLQQYPTLLGMYAIAIGAAAVGRIDPIAHMLGSVEVNVLGDARSISYAVISSDVLDYNMMRATVPDFDNARVPHSMRLFAALQPVAMDIIRDEHRYKKLFDQIEYLFGVASTAQPLLGSGAVGVGAFRRLVGPAEPPDGLIKEYADVLLDAGIFRDRTHLRDCTNAYYSEFERAAQRW
ncbi:MAG: hypothetical protein F4Y18_01580 [Cenarchaeum sp. SB0663_bin_5]|nr:hypothetical protein [Cenarchaeum sp. SB0663_bin_5]MYH04006.1 hypothetical protein [Cenarchaeum sp. SB0675_bin_21]MYL11515.1 hypothetical protein [Cenarchaeum sp. SB0669_bin_11]